ncbi:ribosome-binding protein aMBF1 (putative translation factor) [Rhodoblastus sphagnicola]|nr:helix-turn-helix transcriptional regulator [Rhodoblastus sphagnicola]MBB4199012.1 ribosome-binding protein aMBF1 (putative translation factor) [Rhodoblastus sphagnicola]
MDVTKRSVWRDARIACAESMQTMALRSKRRGGRARPRAGASRMPASENTPRTIDEIVGSRIRARRQELGLCERDLAAALRVTESDIRVYEAGLMRPPASQLLLIAEVLQAPLLEFFDLLNEPPTTAPSSWRAHAPKVGDELARLVSAYLAISDARKREFVLDFVERMGDAG